MNGSKIILLYKIFIFLYEIYLKFRNRNIIDKHFEYFKYTKNSIIDIIRGDK